MYSKASVLSVAGSDSSGGAGIQADIKTIEAMGLFAQTAITSVTAQNTLGVSAVFDVEPHMVKAQIEAVFADMAPQAVKVGMVSSAAIARAVADALEEAGASNIVVDPVMVATSGAALMEPDARQVLVERLFAMATLITPNIPEAAALTGAPIESEADMQRAARALAAMTPGAVLVKGGHGTGAAADVLCVAGECIWFSSPRVATSNTHGTGCTLSSAIACGLASGQALADAVEAGKAFVHGALSAGFAMGKGSGPLDHMWAYRSGERA